MNADIRRLELFRRLLFTLDYYQGVKDTGTGELIPIGVVIEAQSEICVNLRPSAVLFFAFFVLFCGYSVFALSASPCRK